MKETFFFFILQQHITNVIFRHIQLQCHGKGRIFSDSEAVRFFAELNALSWLFDYRNS